MVGAPLLKMLPAWLKPEPELEDRSAGKNLILVHVEPAAECGCEGQVDAALEVSVLTFGAKYFMQFFKKCILTPFTIKVHNGGRGVYTGTIL